MLVHGTCPIPACRGQPLHQEKQQQPSPTLNVEELSFPGLEIYARLNNVETELDLKRLELNTTGA